MDQKTSPECKEIARGRHCQLEIISLDHLEDLFQAYSADVENRIWTYLSYGPFPDINSFRNWFASHIGREDPRFYSIISNESGKALGMASYLRINPKDGVIEIGNINFSPTMQKTTMATEALYLLADYAMADLGYRRLEWKCDSLNQQSRLAARRLGYQFEGVFRQATLYKGRNRDTAWYSILDSEWPDIRAAMTNWLSPVNFDTSGKQYKSLNMLINK